VNGFGTIAWTGVRELRGPLVVLAGVDGVGWDEFATVRLAAGGLRHGLVLSVDHDVAVVQVLEGTAGMEPAGTAVAFAGEPLHVPVGPGWLGRTCNGRGEPIDGGPPVLGDRRAAVSGAPLNPTWREPPSDAVLTGISAIDGLTTLVRGQKLPIFSQAGLPHLRLATQIAAQASVSGEPFAVVFAGMGLTHADAEAVRDALDERAAAGELTLLLQHGRRPGDRADSDSPDRADRGGGPRVHRRPARAGRHDRHDQLRGGGPRGLGGARRAAARLAAGPARAISRSARGWGGSPSSSETPPSIQRVMDRTRTP
jgi:V/A-type H+-transporting ATPase subunit B